MATKILTVDDIEKGIRALITAEKTNLGIEVAVPVAYGDGELVTVVVDQSGPELLVHDASFSSMRLAKLGVLLTPILKHRLTDFARRYHCNFQDGRVYALATMETVPNIVCLVANAARSVGDYAYELKQHVERDFRLIVFDKLREVVGDRAHEADEFKGKSGRRYRMVHVLNENKTKPQNFISTVASRSAITLSFGALYDLGLAFPETERDAIYDDEAGLRDEDRTFLRSANAKVFGWMEAEQRFKDFAHIKQY
jgi:hypothetical protein